MKKEDLKKGEIVIYKSREGPKLEVQLEKETVWLSLDQMAKLFDRDKSVISRHIKNIFQEGELKPHSVIAKFATTASDGKVYQVDYYNLDVIISVGYRVKSQNGVKFRIWATKTLKEHLVKGYSINEKRLLQTQERLKELQNIISFFQKKTKYGLLTGEEQEILNLLTYYSRTLTLLEQYDKEKLTLSKKVKSKFVLKYDEARKIIERLKNNLMDKKEAGKIFGQEVDDKFSAILGNIYQTYGGKELYPSLEEKASHLLYFIIKDHPFVDGNKRIGSFLFVYFLDKNNYLYRSNGERKINNTSLTTLALLIAVSDPQDKEILIRITTNLLSL